MNDAVAVRAENRKVFCSRSSVVLTFGQWTQMVNLAVSRLGAASESARHTYPGIAKIPGFFIPICLRILRCGEVL